MLSEHDVYGVALHPYDKQKYKQEYISAAKQEYITAKQEYITNAAKQEYITNVAKQEYISAKQHEYITSSSVPKQSDYLVGSVGGGHLSGIGGGGGSGLGPPPLTAGSLGGQPLTSSGGLGSRLG